MRVPAHRSLGGVLLLTLAASGWTQNAEEARLAKAAQAMPGLPLAQARTRLVDALAGIQDARAMTAAARDAGTALWRAQRQAVQAGALDDRPLYWQRLAAMQAYRAQCAGEETCRAVLEAFEHAARGIPDLGFPGGADLQIAVSGFDPFNLDDRVDQSNPSGLAALQLDGLQLTVNGRRVRLETVMLPVRFGDFDAGLVESIFTPLLADGTLEALITVSMGREAFDLERFPGRRRSATAPDNLGVRTGASEDRPLVPQLGNAPLPGPEFVEFSLPTAALLTVQGSYPVHDNRTVATLERGRFAASSLADLEGQTAVRGSGGGYLSNEVSYRTVNLALEVGSDAAVGHVHTPRVTGYEAEAEATIVDQVRRLIEAAARAVAEDRPRPADAVTGGSGY